MPFGRPALPGRVCCQLSTVSGNHPYLMAFPAPMAASGGGECSARDVAFYGVRG